MGDLSTEDVNTKYKLALETRQGVHRIILMTDDNKEFDSVSVDQSVESVPVSVVRKDENQQEPLLPKMEELQELLKISQALQNTSRVQFERPVDESIGQGQQAEN